jgi:hypothetical protein
VLALHDALHDGGPEVVGAGVREQLDPAQPGEALAEGRVVRALFEHVGGHTAHHHRRDPDRQPLELVAEGGRAVGEPGLCSGVGGHAGHRGHRREGGDVDDVPAAPSQHPGDRLPAQLQRRGQVQADLGRELLRAVLPQRPRVVDPGVVDEDVDRAGLVLDPVDQSLQLLGIEEVGRVGRPPQRVRQLLQRHAIACDQGDGRTGVGEVAGQGAADPP